MIFLHKNTLFSLTLFDDFNILLAVYKKQTKENK